MSLAVAIIIVLALLVVALGTVAVVMSRAKRLRPHRPGPRGIGWRRGRRLDR